MKRYWSSQKPSGMSAAQSKEWDAFDAKLTPEDVIEMQCIDADCNDCKHFQRGQMVDRVDGLYQSNMLLGFKLFNGTCGKDGSATRAYPGQYTGKQCFDHRRK